MFNKLKQFKDWRGQAKSLQNSLAAEKVEVERGGIKLVMDGNQKVISISFTLAISQPELEDKLPKIFNEALAKAQQLMAQKIQSGGFSLPGM